MEKRYDIHFGTNKLVISSTLIEQRASSISHSEINSADDLCRILNERGDITIITPDTKEVFHKISSLFKQVTAAGGIVSNDNDEDLMIYRNGRWDLPKGHWERGETIEECALREVEEETGVGKLTIGDKICSTRHIYKMRGRWEIKQTHWYKIHSSHTAVLVPQHEEGIEKVAWCSKSQIAEFLPYSYPTIQQVFHEVGKF
ncbi:MAG: NUDIX domain-containing protein [Rikenellaceae bacterium]